MNTTTLILAYGEVRLRLDLPGPVAEGLRRDLDPFFEVADGPFAAIVTVRPERLPDARRPPPEQAERVAVDTSLYAHLASSGLRWEDAERIVVQIELGDTWVLIDKAQGAAEIWQADPERLAIELQRVVKSLFTPLLENNGAMLCHCAAVVPRGGAGGGVLLLGDMWQGKTTVLLELFAGFEIDQLSCDTTCLTPTAHGVSARGWPSPFSMSHGTMADHPRLHEHIPVDRRRLPYDQLWREGRKSVLTSREVTGLFGAGLAPAASTIATTLLLRFRPEGPIGLTPLSDGAAVRAALNLVCLGSRDPIYHNWHRWFVCDEARLEANIGVIAERLLASAPVIEVGWAPSIVSLLKRVAPLAAAHPGLSALASGGTPP